MVCVPLAVLGKQATAAAFALPGSETMPDRATPAPTMTGSKNARAFARLSSETPLSKSPRLDSTTERLSIITPYGRQRRQARGVDETCTEARRNRDLLLPPSS